MERLIHRHKATYDPGFHIEMLLDEQRTQAYAEAIQNIISSDDIVVEPGTGSGVLSILAAGTGAKYVYAIELDEQMASIANNNFLKTPYSARIKLIQGDATEIDLPEHVDVILCEMLHSWLVEEVQAPVTLNLKRFLKPGGRLIPYLVENYATLAYTQSFQPGFPILSPFHLWENDKVTPISLSNSVLVDKINFYTLESLDVNSTITFDITKSGIVNVIALDSRAEMLPGKWLGKTNTLFPTIYIPLDEPVHIYKGEKIQVQFRYQLGDRWTEIDIKLG